MLIDGPSLVYRGYFALPPLTMSDGTLVNAVFGFLQIVLRGMQDLKPDYAIAQLRPRPAAVPLRRLPGVQGRAAVDAGRPAQPVPDRARDRRR